VIGLSSFTEDVLTNVNKHGNLANVQILLSNQDKIVFEPSYLLDEPSSIDEGCFFSQILKTLEEASLKAEAGSIDFAVTITYSFCMDQYDSVGKNS